MQNHQIDLVKKMFEYNLWANTQLIEICGELDDAQLEIDIEGVYGRIHPTLVHLIRAEGGYLNRITGSRPWPDDLEWSNLTMSDLLAKAQLSGNQLIAVAGTADPAIDHVIDLEGETFRFFNWTVLLQALYHGIEHRTQVKFLLTQIGVTHPELAAWDYTESLSL